jgi:hypothetical protein
VTSGITLYQNYDMTDTTSYFYLLNYYSDTTNGTDDLLLFGTTVATIFRDFFNIVIPDYTVDM